MSRFIVIEGLDGAGTTTQCDRLAAHLSHPLRTFQPSDLPIGRMIRQTLNRAVDAPNRTILPWMFAADRADHLERQIRPALAQGRDVVCDRYVPSSLAYQALEIPMDEVWMLNSTFEAPDLTVFIDVPVDVALQRISGRGQATEVYEKAELLKRIHANYEEALLRLDGRGDAIARVDGTQSIDVVFQQILTALSR